MGHKLESEIKWLIIQWDFREKLKLFLGEKKNICSWKLKTRNSGIPQTQYTFEIFMRLNYNSFISINLYLNQDCHLRKMWFDQVSSIWILKFCIRKHFPLFQARNKQTFFVNSKIKQSRYFWRSLYSVLENSWSAIVKGIVQNLITWQIDFF